MVSFPKTTTTKPLAAAQKSAAAIAAMTGRIDISILHAQMVPLTANLHLRRIRPKAGVQPNI